MNIYTFDIFIHHCISVEDIIKNNKITSYLHYLEIGPLNLPESFHLNIIKEAIRNISSTQVTTNWWTDFSSWRDYHGLLRSGTNLSIHSVVKDIDKRFKLIQKGGCSIDQIDDNGNFTIDLNEFFPTLMKGYIITAKRRKLRKLEQISAYNVAKCLSSEDDIGKLYIPRSLYRVVATFLDTYSGDYMFQ